MRFQFVMLYTARHRGLLAAAAGRDGGGRGGALRVGAEHGLPLHHFPLEETAAAHDAVEGGLVGKVLLDVAVD